MGKTVLLWEFVDCARKVGYAVVNPTAVRSNIVERKCEKLEAGAESLLSQKKHHVSGASLGALGFSAGLTLENNARPSLSYERRIVEAVRKLTEKGVGTLFLADELQSNSGEMRSLIGTYQEMVGEGINVAIVLAGLPMAVAGTLNDHVLTFLNRARKVNLDPLEFGDIDAYYCRAFESCSVKITSEARRQASISTDGSPYLMQLIGHYIVVYSKDDGTVDNSVINDVLYFARREFKDDVCETTLAALSGRDVDYLRAMAAVSENGEALTSKSQSTWGSQLTTANSTGGA